MTVKHPTASAFVFCRHSGGWRLGLVEHPLQGRLMIPGGHVEADESQAEAVLREVEEEAALRVRLLDAPATPLPAGYPHDRVPPPWWITELPAPADNHLAEPHVHVDHQYVAVSEGPTPAAEPAHPFGWYAADELADLHMYEGTRLLAAALFPRIHDLAESLFPDGQNHHLGQFSEIKLWASPTLTARRDSLLKQTTWAGGKSFRQGSRSAPRPATPGQSKCRSQESARPGRNLRHALPLGHRQRRSSAWP